MEKTYIEIINGSIISRSIPLKATSESIHSRSILLVAVLTAMVKYEDHAMTW